MGTKKDIGKLFKERLGHLEQSPDAGLWDNIASELDKSQSRRIAPLWYYFGGAAVLAILALIWFTEPVIISNPIEQEVVETNTSIKVNQSNSTSTNTTSTIEKEQSLNQIVQKDIVAGKNSTTPNTPLNPANIDSSSNEQDLSNENATTNRTRSSNDADSITGLNTNELTYATSTNKVGNNNNDLRLEKKTLITTLEDFKAAIAEQMKYNASKEKTARAAYEAKIKSEMEAAIASQKEEESLKIKDLIKQKKDSLALLQKELASQNNKKTLQKRLPKTPNERSEDRKSAIEYEVAVSPYTSFLSYGSLTKASSIDDRLVNNPRNAISTVGFGIRVDYTLGEKTSLRLGVGYAPLKYETENFQVSVNNGSINIYELAAINSGNLNNGNTAENTPQALSFFSANNVVSIQQNISYLEVPVDFQYRFINKRVAFSISPGVSMFILNNNEIFATADSGQSIFVGRETNLKGLSLAFNLGLGGHYNINNKWRLNVEPVFRYQLNPYNNNLSNFRPYYIGAQFGMSYKF